MEDPRPLEGMARSIDDLFNDAERRREEPSGEAMDEEASGAAAEAEPVPPAGPGEPSEAGEAPDADAGRVASEEALERARRNVDEVVGSADLLDDVEVIVPRGGERAGPARPEPIDAESDEDPDELARAAAWTAEGARRAETSVEASPPEPPRDVRPPDAPALADAGTDAPATPPDAPDEVALRARALAKAVEAYFEAEPRRREAAADRVREATAAHREAREVDAPADAVERLALDGSSTAVDLAKEIAVPAVTSRLVVRLGMAREEDRRAELLRVAEILGPAVAPAIADALSQADDRSARRNFVEALVRLGEPGLREAEAMVADPRWFVVRNGVSILGEVGGERAVEHLTSTLAHEDLRVRRETLMGLARIGGDDAGILVTGKLEDPDAEVRAGAAMAVGELKVERAQRTLQAMLETEDDEDALVEVLRALGRLGDPGAVPAIEKKAVGSFFSRPPTTVRMAAFRALAAIGTPHARQVIEAAAEDKDADVRRLATELLKGR